MNTEINENSSKVIILVGRSGSGKGTQGKFIKSFLEKHFPENEMHYLSTGEEMRRIMKQSSYTARLSRDAMDTGKLQPMFFSVYVWAKYLMEHVHGNDNIVFDGVPRRKEEAKILHSAVKFYNWGKPVVINIDVSEEECVRRMMERKRDDDNVENFKKKMDWYKMEVEPMLQWYSESNLYHYVRIHGEDSVENISKHIEHFLESHYDLQSN
jgi:adenylate kinase family enzyme